jgi:pimeloyl-ACP methyl ester carboxylesterase
MVGHSIGGIYVRKYAALHPADVVGMIVLDSAHEEQSHGFRRCRPSGLDALPANFQPTTSVSGDSCCQTSDWLGISTNH